MVINRDLGDLLNIFGLETEALIKAVNMCQFRIDYFCCYQENITKKDQNKNIYVPVKYLKNFFLRGTMFWGSSFSCRTRHSQIQ